MHTPSIVNLTLAGLLGDDVFNLTGGMPFSNVTVDGGDPSASDTLNLTTPSGAAVAVALGDSTIPTNTTITGYTTPAASTVTLAGIEVANLSLTNANATSVPLTATGTATKTTRSFTRRAAPRPARSHRPA